jgi:hypothetical protein
VRDAFYIRAVRGGTRRVVRAAQTGANPPPPSQIDTEALDKLMEEKRARAEAAADESAADLAENSRIAAAVEELSKIEKAAKIALQRETAAEVEAQIASQHLRDTADLNDKHRLQRQGLTRNGDDDPRLGPSSAQVFAGEDLFASERRKLQHTQMQAWTVQQVAEKSARAAAEKAVDKAYAAAVTAACGTVDSLQSGTAALVKARTLEASAANLKLMNGRRAAKANASAEDKVRCARPHPAQSPHAKRSPHPTRRQWMRRATARCARAGRAWACCQRTWQMAFPPRTRDATVLTTTVAGRRARRWPL